MGRLERGSGQTTIPCEPFEKVIYFTGGLREGAGINHMIARSLGARYIILCLLIILLCLL